MKVIWLVNPYCVPKEYETRLRTIKFAQYLNAMGYAVRLFGGSYIHNTNINLILDNEDYIISQHENCEFVHIKTQEYHGNGLNRFKNLMQFYKGFSRIYQKFDKPDIILHTGTIPFGKCVYKIAEKLNSKYLLEILDLWPESFLAFGLINNGLVLKALRMIEKKFYIKAHNIYFSMEGGIDYIYERNWQKDIDFKKIKYINNGVDLSDFNSNLNSFKLDDLDLEDGSTFKVIYLGSIRKANNIKLLIDAAEILKNDNQIKFFIYGDGDERDMLENYVNDKKLNNVLFKQKKIPIEYVPYVLSKSSLNILNYMPNDIWRFGGSQSKLFQYLAAGKPILSNLKIGYCIITDNECGVAQKFETKEMYAQEIYKFFTMPKEMYLRMCENARNAAREYDYKELTKKLVKTFN